MADNPMQVFRSYFVINAGTLSPTEQNWRDLVAQTKTHPFAAGILTIARACQNFISASKRSLGAGYELKNTLCVFEIEEAYKATVLALLDAQATADGCTGNIPTELAGVLQYEIRAAALELGYTQANANKLSVRLINTTGCFDRDCAILAAQQELVTNTAIWHAPQ